MNKFSWDLKRCADDKIRVSMKDYAMSMEEIKDKKEDIEIIS